MDRQFTDQLDEKQFNVRSQTLRCRPMFQQRIYHARFLKCMITIFHPSFQPPTLLVACDGNDNNQVITKQHSHLRSKIAMGSGEGCNMGMWFCLLLTYNSSKDEGFSMQYTLRENRHCYLDVDTGWFHLLYDNR